MIVLVFSTKARKWNKEHSQRRNTKTSPLEEASVAFQEVSEVFNGVSEGPGGFQEIPVGFRGFQEVPEALPRVPGSLLRRSLGRFRELWEYISRRVREGLRGVPGWLEGVSVVQGGLWGISGSLTSISWNLRIVSEGLRGVSQGSRWFQEIFTSSSGYDRSSETSQRCFCESQGVWWGLKGPSGCSVGIRGVLEGIRGVPGWLRGVRVVPGGLRGVSGSLTGVSGNLRVFQRVSEGSSRLSGGSNGLKAGTKRPLGHFREPRVYQEVSWAYMGAQLILEGSWGSQGVLGWLRVLFNGFHVAFRDIPGGCRDVSGGLAGISGSLRGFQWHFRGSQAEMPDNFIKNLYQYGFFLYRRIWGYSSRKCSLISLKISSNFMLFGEICITF